MGANAEVHRLVHIWQERPGEFSWRCACGCIHKHYPFGDLRYICEEQP